MLQLICICSLSLSDYSDVSQIIIGCITAIIGLLTFNLAFKVHKEFTKNHAHSKQVEKMCDLLEYLNNTKIHLTFTDFYKSGEAGSSSLAIYYNIFEIGYLLNNKNIHLPSKRTIDFTEYDNYPVVLDCKSYQVIDIKKYIDNPFIPKNIADKLLDFHVNSEDIISYKDLNNTDTSIIVLNSTDVQNRFDSFKKTNCESLKSWLNLKTHSHDLIKEISDWFVSKGIIDFNLRIDYKNIVTKKHFSL